MNVTRNRVLAIAVVGLWGCSPQDASISESLGEKTNLSEHEVRSLFVPEPASSPEEYLAQSLSLRLFGVQLRDQRFATVANTVTWSTRNLREGDLIARNIRVQSLEQGRIHLATPEGLVELEVGGRDLTLRAVRHRFDLAVESLGRHRWRVNRDALGAIYSRYGVGAVGKPIAVLGENGVELAAVDPNGALARLGLRAGAILVSAGGESVEATRLDQVIERILAARGSQVSIRAYVNGHGTSVTYLVE